MSQFGKCFGGQLDDVIDLLCLGIAQWLANLAVVTVDSQRLDAHLPCFEVDLFNFVDGGIFWHVHGL